MLPRFASDEMTSPSSGFSFFDTAIGPCGIAWSPAGITAVRFPTRDRGAARAALARAGNDEACVETSPPPAIAGAAARIASVLDGRADDLEGLELDLSRVAAFDRDVYAVARRIPFGRTRTYGEIATELGDPLLAREVGAALGRNPVPIVVPCHRVVAAGERLGGFSGAGGIETKTRLLRIEGATLADRGPTLFQQAGILL